MNAEVRIQFERECGECYGNGYLLTARDEIKGSCPKCKGCGSIATELGQELLEFLEHQGFKPTTSTKET